MGARTSRLRSVLYVPAANERALEKARSLAADALILDLEDSVAPQSKAAARERACELVVSGVYGERTVAIRINAIGTPWHDEDLAAAAAAGPAAVVVPKLQLAQDVVAVEHVLQRNPAPHTEIWGMLETPLAVWRAGEIAAASDRLSALVVGTNDLLAELQALGPDRRPLETSLQLCLLAARANRRSILDGVYNDVHDAAGFEAECRQARQLGFDGKTLIHPAQVEICNRVFAPSDGEIAQARRVIDAFQEAAKAGNAVATVDGRLVEGLHVESARRILGLPGASVKSS